LDNRASQLLPAEAIGQLPRDGGELQIAFVMPTAKEESPPIDVTPSPYDGQAADLSKPALPPPPERKPGPRGLWLEEPPTSTSWMK
jgi:hypothetical protein